MTPNELSVLVAEPLGRQFDVAFRLQVQDRIKYWSAEFVRRAINKAASKRERESAIDLFSRVLYFPLIEVDPLPLFKGIGCKILRTVDPIPIPNPNGSKLFNYVGTAFYPKEFTKVTSRTREFRDIKKYGPPVISYEFANNYLYVYGSEDLKVIKAEYVPENPFEAHTYGSAEGTPTTCWEDTELSIPLYMQTMIVNEILTKDYNRSVNSNDSSVKVEAASTSEQ